MGIDYKLFMFDIDGTLHDSTKHILPETKAALQKLLKEDKKVVIASGRCTHGVMPVALELGMDELGGYIIPYNGGQIIECKTKEIIFEKCLPKGAIIDVFAFAKSFGADLMFYKDDIIYSNNPDNKYVLLEANNTHMQIRKTEDFSEFADWNIIELLICGDPEILIPQVEPAKELFGDFADAFRSDPYYIIIVPDGVSKREGLKNLLQHYNIPREESMAFGDGYNDITMLEYAGMAVVMENAEDPIKEVADYITKSCDDEGIARALEVLLL